VTVISIDEFRAAARRGERPAGTVQRLAVAEPIQIDEASRKVSLCFSDSSVDRMGDVIDAEGWQLDNYRKNNVVLWAHDALAPPIGRASNVRVQGNRLLGDIEFASAEIYPFADQIYRLVRTRFLGACSVGFRPIEFAFSRDPARRGGIDFLRVELLEVSVVPIPANPNALIEGRAMKSAADDSAQRIATLARLRNPPARPRSIERTADELQVMPPGFCGRWCEHQAQRAAQDTRRRIARLLRLALRSRPETQAQREFVTGELARLRALENAVR
jgi:HK97 family phage prohead protease